MIPADEVIASCTDPQRRVLLTLTADQMSWLASEHAAGVDFGAHRDDLLYRVMQIDEMLTLADWSETQAAFLRACRQWITDHIPREGLH